MLRACFLLCLFLPTLAQALPPHSPRPGGIAVVELGERLAAPEAGFEGRRVLTVRRDGRWWAVVGIPLDREPGEARVTLADGEPRSFEVRSHAYREQRLEVEPSYVSPGEDALERIARERERIGRAITQFSPTPPDALSLAAPVPGSRSDSFGYRRIFNDEPRSPHRGMDMQGARGTPVAAPLAGRVLEADDFYFTGNAVFLDHGQGLVTLYAHLDRIDVAAQDTVAAGDVIGTVGATGRVTGPHLHFAVYLNGTPVDPALLLPD